MSSNAQSEDLERFMASLDATPDTSEATDRFDLEALARLAGGEREQAEHALIRRLDHADARVAPALVVLGARNAVGPLRAALARHTGAVKVSTAEALWDLDHDPAAVDTIIDVLEGSDADGRAWAACALRRFDGPRVDDALLAALNDPVETVGLGTAESLYRKLGLEPYAQRKRGRLNMLRVRLQSTLETVRSPAISELKTLIDKLHAGQTPEQLGLTLAGDSENRAVQRFIDSYLDPSAKDFDVDSIRALAGDELAFAEVMLMYFAERGDARAFRAISALPMRSAGPSLQELSRRTGAAAVLAAAALSRLRGLPP